MGVRVGMGIRITVGVGVRITVGMGIRVEMRIRESDVYDGGLHVMHLADVMLDFVLGSEQLIERKAVIDFNPHYRMAADDSNEEEKAY